MTLIAGDAVKGTGLAGAIAKARKKAFPAGYDPRKDKSVNLEAKAIIDYFVDNAVINTTVTVEEAPGGVPLVPPGIGTGEGTLE